MLVEETVLVHNTNCCYCWLWRPSVACSWPMKQIGCSSFRHKYTVRGKLVLVQNYVGNNSVADITRIRK